MQPQLRPSAAQAVLAQAWAEEKKHWPVLSASVVVGVLAGGAGTLFQWGIGAAEKLFLRLDSQTATGPVPGWFVAAGISAVLVGGSLWLVRRFAPEAGGSGIQEIEGALAGVRAARWERVVPVKFIGGLMALGAGLALGREGPTVQMGGNLGQMIGRWMRAREEQLHILVAAGAGAGISAAFNAPLAGILFVIEEMRPHFRYGFLSVQSVVIASASADIVLRLAMGQAPDIDMRHFAAPPLSSLGLFLLLGVLLGLFGYAFNGTLVATLDLFGRLRGRSVLVGGLTVGAAIGLLAWLGPRVAAFGPGLTGGGYHVIPWAMLQSDGAAWLLAICAARFATTMVSYGCGAPGGIFAPMLALATLFGMSFGITAQHWFPGIVTHPAIFAVAGMGALFAATVRAPLTGIALTIEMTQNYALILPLILTCWAATIVAQGLGARPIYTVLLERTLQGTNQTKNNSTSEDQR